MIRGCRARVVRRPTTKHKMSSAGCVRSPQRVTHRPFKLNHVMDNLSNYNSTVISFSLVQNLQHNTSSQQAPQMQEQNKLARNNYSRHSRCDGSHVVAGNNVSRVLKPSRLLLIVSTNRLLTQQRRPLSFRATKHRI